MKRFSQHKPFELKRVNWKKKIYYEQCIIVLLK